MLTATLTALAFIGLSSAQSTVSLFLLSTDNQSLVGSIVGSDSTATTYVIQCPPGTDSNDCGYPIPVTVMQGPATVFYSMSLPGFTADFGCSLGGTTTAICSQSVGGSDANSPGQATETLAASDITFLPVVITAEAGAGNTASTAPATTTAEVTSDSSSSMPTTASSSGATSTMSMTTSMAASQSTGTGDVQAAASTLVSTGGYPQITGNAQWAVGGAAVALALAAL
ncbi:Mucin-21 [Lignoscripta atroalba]|nr:Mucin-21 [Lignoscripta atroalba]